MHTVFPIHLVLLDLITIIVFSTIL
jgi:hypothetical protein